MNKDLTLTTEDREFFGLVNDAAFANPFSDDRTELDRRIGGSHSPNRLKTIDAAIGAVRQRITALEAEGRANLRLYGGDDRVLLRSGLLWDTYHRDLQAMDHHIRQQVDAGDTPLPVSFAPETLARLNRFGFERQERLLYFGFFFQLRRAFYFINEGLVGEGRAMLELKRRLWQNLFTGNSRWYETFLWNRMEDFSTLLLGETGTGKGAAAAAIGRSGFIPFDDRQNRFAESFTRSFVATNLSEFPSSLIESELFGHRKGAFTGAIESHQGVFNRCSEHGAIFLDEVGELDIPLQIKLLRVLQDRTFTPVGSHAQQRFCGRIIAATNRPIATMRQDQTFRDDLYYRLCTDEIVLPPLRQRIAEDKRELPRMVGLLVQRTIGAPDPELTERLCKSLRQAPGPDYPWPGNVRELEQAVRRLLLGHPYPGQILPAQGAPALNRAIEEGRLTANALLARYCRQLYQQHGTYEAVARITQLDRRTAKKHVESASD